MTDLTIIRFLTRAHDQFDLPILTQLKSMQTSILPAKSILNREV